MKDQRYLLLRKNVYLVNGAIRSAIYDLNKEFLYSINNATKELIEKVGINIFDEKFFSDEENAVIEQLINNGIITHSSLPNQKVDINILKNMGYPAQFVWLEVTQQCNMACPFCYEKSDMSYKKQMDFNDFKLAVKNLKTIGIKRIQFIGGEPLLLKNTLKDMVCHCKRAFDFIEIFTNGTLIDEEWCIFFKRNKINIAISLHSYNPIQHDNLVCSLGAHDKIIQSINLFDQYNIKYRLATIKNRGYEIGFPDTNTSYKLYPKNPKITGRAQFDQYDYDMFKSKAITKSSFSKPINKKIVATAVNGFRCFLKNFYIAANLTVYPCVMERRFNYGNLKETSLRTMLDNQLRFLSKDQIEDCQDCEYRYACYDCRPDANGEGLYQKPWYCSYEPKKGTWKNLPEMFEKLCSKASEF